MAGQAHANGTMERTLPLGNVARHVVHGTKKLRERITSSRQMEECSGARNVALESVLIMLSKLMQDLVVCFEHSKEIGKLIDQLEAEIIACMVSSIAQPLMLMKAGVY